MGAQKRIQADWVLIGAAKPWLEMIIFIGQMAVGFFLMCSLYLPLVPFIIFMGQVLNWLITVIEGVCAAPFLAFAHLDTDGEGLGHKTQYGYTFMLSSFMRPVMLVLGFVIACILIEVIGGFLMGIFPTVLANVEMDSMTGFFSILGYIAIFMVLMVILTNSAMSVTYLLPDAIFQFIGAHNSATAQVGRDTASHAERGALGGAAISNRGTQSMSRMAQELNPKRRPGSGGATGGGVKAGERA